MAGEIVDYQSGLHFLVHELGFTEQVAAIGLEEPGYLTVEKMQLFSSISGLTALIRSARKVEDLWLPEIARTSGTLRVAMKKTPVNIAGGILGGALQSREEIRESLERSRDVLIGVVDAYRSSGDVFFPDLWQEWYPKTEALLQELDEVLQTI